MTNSYRKHMIETSARVIAARITEHFMPDGLIPAWTNDLRQRVMDRAADMIDHNPILKGFRVVDAVLVPTDTGYAASIALCPPPGMVSEIKVHIVKDPHIAKRPLTKPEPQRPMLTPERIERARLADTPAPVEHIWEKGADRPLTFVEIAPSYMDEDDFLTEPDKTWGKDE